MIEVIKKKASVKINIFICFYFLGKNTLNYSRGGAWRTIDVLGKYCPPN